MGNETMAMNPRSAGLAVALLAALLIHAGALAAFLWWPPATSTAPKTPGAAGLRLALGPRASDPVVPDIPQQSHPQQTQTTPIPPDTPAPSPPPQAVPVTGLTIGAGESAARIAGEMLGLGEGTAQATYLAELQSWLARYKKYPYSARRRGLEGRAILRFTVARSGDVLDYRLDQSTGVAVLDREVEKMIERAQPLPPFPPELDRDTLDVIIPVKFDLD